MINGQKIFSFVRISFIILAIVGISFLLPLVTALALGEKDALLPFALPMVCAVVPGILFYFAGRKKTFSLGIRGVFAFVSFAWIAVSLLGAVPLYAGGWIPDFTDAVFEAVSGFSTTGATVLADVENLPESVNLWRLEMHWLGGMGIIALTTAVLPLLGVGGFQLVKAESTGPEKGKITPKMANMAKALWTIYLALTVLQTVLLKICGLSFVDSLGHAFSTLGTGGFSTKNASVGGFNSPAVEVICTVFMVLSSINFSLYFYLFTKKINEVKNNSELKAFAGIFVFVTVALALTLIKFYGGFAQALRHAVFQVASIMSTTGFATANFMEWPPAAQFFIFLLFFTGGCSGSTAGGFKVVRWMILAKSSRSQMLKMLHPHGVFSVRVDGSAGREDLVLNIASFIFVYLALVFAATFAGTLAGLPLFEAFTAGLSFLGNIGRAFSPFSDYGWLPGGLKWFYCFIMIAGRLELYNLLILFTKDFWKK